jgi:hypothetical protein
MDPEATRWENIAFRCAFMGVSFSEAERLAPAITRTHLLSEATKQRPGKRVPDFAAAQSALQQARTHRYI